MKVLVIGANGQLGTDLQRALGRRNLTVLPVTHRELEIRDPEQVSEAVEGFRPDAVINTAAFHKVEECERQASLAFEVNALGAWTLAQACSRAGLVLVHFSTDYVFDGRERRPYSENDLPNPLNVYGASKLAGEHLIAAACPRHFIIRTCGLYGIAGSSGKGGNFVESMLRKADARTSIRVVDDQIVTPTFTGDLAEAVAELIVTDEYGLYHVSSEGECSWYQFAKKIFELADLDVDVAPITSDQLSSPVKRPPYSVLSKQKLGKIGLRLPTWEDALGRYLQSRGQPDTEGRCVSGTALGKHR
jgi:dTDP-4-dehydrorhamnose reductase